MSNNAFDPNIAPELRAEEASDFSIFEKELSFLHFLASSHNATACVSRGPPERARERFHSVLVLNFL